MTDLERAELRAEKAIGVVRAAARMLDSHGFGEDADALRAFVERIDNASPEVVELRRDLEDARALYLEEAQEHHGTARMFAHSRAMSWAWKTLARNRGQALQLLRETVRRQAERLQALLAADRVARGTPAPPTAVHVEPEPVERDGWSVACACPSCQRGVTRHPPATALYLKGQTKP
jgi:hypothetical protein